jgi:hypothetical protein
MKSIKYQLLKDDFDHSIYQIKLLHQRIKELEKENKALTSTIDVDRHEYKELWEMYLKIKEENECLRDDLLIARNEI